MTSHSVIPSPMSASLNFSSLRANQGGQPWNRAALKYGLADGIRPWNLARNMEEDEKEPTPDLTAAMSDERLDV